MISVNDNKPIRPASWVRLESGLACAVVILEKRYNYGFEQVFHDRWLSYKVFLSVPTLLTRALRFMRQRDRQKGEKCAILLRHTGGSGSVHGKLEGGKRKVWDALKSLL